MQIASLQQAKEQVQREIAERQELMRAYDLVARDIEHRAPTQIAVTMNSHPPARVRTVPDRARRVVVSKPISKADLVRAAIDKSPPDFNLNNVSEQLTASGTPMKRDDISFVLSRMKKHGEICVVTLGKGSMASVFKKNLPAETTKNANGRESGLHAKEEDSHP